MLQSGHGFRDHCSYTETDPHSHEPTWLGGPIGSHRQWFEPCALYGSQLPDRGSIIGCPGGSFGVPDPDPRLMVIVCISRIHQNADSNTPHCVSGACTGPYRSRNPDTTVTLLSDSKCCSCVSCLRVMCMSFSLTILLVSCLCVMYTYMS